MYYVYVKKERKKHLAVLVILQNLFFLFCFERKNDESVKIFSS